MHYFCYRASKTFIPLLISLCICLHKPNIYIAPAYRRNISAYQCVVCPAYKIATIRCLVHTAQVVLAYSAVAPIPLFITQRINFYQPQIAGGKHTGCGIPVSLGFIAGAVRTGGPTYKITAIGSLFKTCHTIIFGTAITLIPLLYQGVLSRRKKRTK